MGGHEWVMQPFPSLEHVLPNGDLKFFIFLAVQKDFLLHSTSWAFTVTTRWGGQYGGRLQAALTRTTWSQQRGWGEDREGAPEGWSLLKARRRANFDRRLRHNVLDITSKLLLLKILNVSNKKKNTWLTELAADIQGWKRSGTLTLIHPVFFCLSPINNLKINFLTYLII